MIKAIITRGLNVEVYYLITNGLALGSEEAPESPNPNSSVAIQIGIEI